MTTMNPSLLNFGLQDTSIMLPSVTGADSARILSQPNPRYPFLPNPNVRESQFWSDSPLQQQRPFAMRRSADDALPTSVAAVSNPSGRRAEDQGQAMSNFGSRKILPLPTPRLRDLRERKRSKLSMDKTPFDSVDYWIQFDDEETDPDNRASSSERMDVDEDRSISSPTSRSTPNTSRHQSYTSSKSGQLDTQDDSALELAISDEEFEPNLFSINLKDHLASMDSAVTPPTDVPPREGLYSTPLSWERPHFGAPRQETSAMTPPVAMFMGDNDLPSASAVVEAMAGEQTTPPAQAQAPAPAPASDDDCCGGKSAHKRGSDSEDRKDKKSLPKLNREKTAAAKSADRTAHNNIERKYRTNLKDKIAELRDAVPTLRAQSSADSDDDDEQAPRAPKVSKGIVLTKATEYIHFLERRNKAIARQNQELGTRLRAFEQQLTSASAAAAAAAMFQVPNFDASLFSSGGYR